MVEIEFEEETITPVNQIEYQKTKGLTGWLLSVGVVSSTKQANVIFLGLIITLFLLAIYLVTASLKPNPAPPTNTSIPLVDPIVGN